MAHLAAAAPQDVEQRTGTPSNALNEDDGMQDLRRKMLEIQSLALSTAETARRMHEVMTEDYRRRHRLDTPRKEVSSTRRPIRALHSERIEVSETDRQPSYCPPVKEHEELDEALDQMEEAPSLGCRHYKRNVKVQCWDCQLWFPCRFCHDSSPDLPWHHQLNRKKTQHMLCMVCGTAQPASDVCSSCETESAYYYCPKCKLWDNDSSKRIYHCDDCGICRRGEGLGKDYVHCKRCNVCISISTSADHPCIERATDCDCPLCLDYLFSSATPVVSLLCGHYMHALCYKDLMNVTYRCPVCSKSAVNMELQWRKLDDEIRMQPMPEEDFENDDNDNDSSRPRTPDDSVQSDSRLAGGLANLSLFRPPAAPRRVPRKVWVGCNDCGGRGWTPFHWLGLKCPVCDGYNTNQMTPTGSRAHDVAAMPGTVRQRQHDFTGAAIMSSFEDPALATVAAQPRFGAGDASDGNTGGNGITLGRLGDERSPSRPATAGGAVDGARPRSYFLSSSPSSPPSPRSWARRSWASSLSPSRFASFRQAPSSATSTGAIDDDGHEQGDQDTPPAATSVNTLSDPDLPTSSTTAAVDAAASVKQDAHDADYMTLAMARLDRFGISPSEFLARLNVGSPADFLERFGNGAVPSPAELLQRVMGRSLSPMRHYLGSLDANARDRAAKAREYAGGFMSGAAGVGGAGGGMRWSRRDVAEGLERWERGWREYYNHMAKGEGVDGSSSKRRRPRAPRPTEGRRRAKSENDVAGARMRAKRGLDTGLVSSDGLDVGQEELVSRWGGAVLDGREHDPHGEDYGGDDDDYDDEDEEEEEDEDDDEESDSESETSDLGAVDDGVDDFELPGHRHVFRFIDFANLMSSILQTPTPHHQPHVYEYEHRRGNSHDEVDLIDRAMSDLASASSALPPRLISVDEAGNVLATFVPSATRGADGRHVTRIDVIKPPQSVKGVLQTLLDVFLPAGYPHSVTDDYLEYQIYDSLQAFASSIAGLLSSRAALESTGFNDPAATSTGAVLVSILQQSLGRVCTIAFAARLGSSLEPECKRYRLLADVLNDAAMVLECASPLLPVSTRIAVLSVAAAGKALCGVAAGASKASLSARFARAANLAEVSAKDASQETVVSLVGMWAGSVVVSYVPAGGGVAWAVLLLLLGLHLAANYRAVRAVRMASLNRQRAGIVFGRYVRSGRVMTPEDVRREERIFEWDGVVRDSTGYVLGYATIGEPLERYLSLMRQHGSHTITPPAGLSGLSKSGEARQKFLIHLDQDGRKVAIALENGCSIRDQLQAWFAAYQALLLSSSPGRHRDIRELALAAQGARSSESSSTIMAEALALTEQVFPTLERELNEAGWDLTSAALETGPALRYAIAVGPH